jgi:hypothetical protein
MRKNRLSSKWLSVIAFSVVLVMLLVSIPKTPVSAAPPLPGAIFTTNVTGVRVNQNQYVNKCDVYLDGGPGANAPATAAGLPDGDYYFQVTDPSGKTLLSTDAVKFRQFHVSGGVISGLSGAGNHGTGFDTTNNGATIQLCPFLDTPNPGGVYKAWVTPIADFVGDPTKVDNPCGNGCFHGFIPAASKVDNFKVSSQAAGVACLGVFKFIDNNGNGVRDSNDPLVLGWGFRVIDPLGAEIGGTLFTESEKNCEPGLFNLLPGRYTVIEDATNGTGNFVVTANIVDNTKQNPVDTQITVKFAPGDLRHDATFGNQPVP